MRTIALMLESEGPGGAEVVVLRLAEELRSRGHEVVPVVLTHASQPGWLENEFSSRGFAPERAFIRGGVDLRCLRELVSTLRRRGAHVVHSHEFGMAVYGTAAARALRLPHVITMHGNMWMTNALRRRLALRWAFRRSKTTAVSEDTRRHLLSALGIHSSVVTTVLNGVPIVQGERELLRRELALAPESVLVVAVGNLIERKGHAILLRALAQAHSANPAADWRLAIAGEGVERPKLEALAAELGISERVHLLGHRSDVGNVLHAADVFVMPSLWEGLPLAVLEAMFVGLPVVASDISGIPEAISSRAEGWLVPAGEIAPLADAVGRLVTDSMLRREMGAAARRRAMERFTVRAMADAYERLYGTLRAA